MSNSMLIDIDEVDAPDNEACNCHETNAKISKQLDEIMEVVAAVYAEVTPTLDALKKNPMLKMFFN